MIKKSKLDKEVAELVMASMNESQLQRIPSIETNIVPKIISYCISSGKAEPMKLNEGPRGIFENRSQVHVMLLQPFGSGKSTALANLEGVHPLINFTLPGFVGTINKQGQLVDSALSQAAGKTLFIDEFHNLAGGARQAMLSLLEDQRYSRALGFAAESRKINKKYFKIHVQKNYLNIKFCRFSCLVTGLYMARKKLNDQALASRFIILNVKTSRDDIVRLLQGRSLFGIKKFNFKGGVLFNNYLAFLDDVGKIIDNLPYNAIKVNEYYSRVVNDLARIICHHNERFGNFVIESKRDYDGLLGLTPLLFFNHLSSGLTLAEYQILNSLIFDTANHTEIAGSLNISRRYVINVHKKLTHLGLINKG